MLGYCTIGTNDLVKAGAFYDEIAKILGHGRVMENDRVIMWGSPGKGAMLGLIKPRDEKPATVGNGSMFGFHADSEEQVNQVYDFALANGGSDEGPPGPRGDNFYGAYFRDPEGNKLVCFQMK
jgi:catechol 2,3-dioxygenase-like lactoylglutathione lyase family enzyme